MKNRRNYYRILQVQPDARTEVIRASYRAMMQKLRMHPDLGGDKASAAVLNEAYAVLSDPVRRARYDEDNKFFERQSAGGSPRSEPSEPKSPPPQREPASRDTEAKPGPESAYQAADASLVRCEFCNGVVSRVSRLLATNTCACCNSPLSPVAELGDGRADSRRELARVGKTLGINFYTAWPQAHPHTATAFDLSLKGLGLHTLVPVPTGSVIKVDSPTVRGVAKVVNCRTAKLNGRAVYQLGAQFLTIEFTRAHGTFVSGRA